MGNLNVPDRYIDALCGRVPNSVLARRYTDYSPEKLHRIYEKAKLSVLNEKRVNTRATTAPVVVSQ